MRKKHAMQEPGGGKKRVIKTKITGTEPGASAERSKMGKLKRLPKKIIREREVKCPRFGRN